MIEKNEEMKELEVLISKKENELLEVKTVMMRTAGKDFENQISVLREKIKDLSPYSKILNKTIIYSLFLYESYTNTR